MKKYTLAEVRDGTGFDKSARFALIDTRAEANSKQLEETDRVIKNMSHFLFDVQLAASIRVVAPCEASAREALSTMLDCASVTLADPRGEPVTFEASLADESPTLVERDGEAI
jgi:hypothetical protein